MRNEFTEWLIAEQVRGGRVVAALMLDTFTQLDARGVSLDRAVELAVTAAVRSELGGRSYPRIGPGIGCGF